MDKRVWGPLTGFVGPLGLATLIKDSCRMENDSQIVGRHLLSAGYTMVNFLELSYVLL